jgi:hypothetical protein
MFSKTLLIADVFGVCWEVLKEWWLMMMMMGSIWKKAQFEQHSYFVLERRQNWKILDLVCVYNLELVLKNERIYERYCQFSPV